jgi:hypothetical protein
MCDSPRQVTVDSWPRCRSAVTLRDGQSKSQNDAGGVDALADFGGRFAGVRYPPLIARRPLANGKYLKSGLFRQDFLRKKVFFARFSEIDQY